MSCLVLSHALGLTEKGTLKPASAVNNEAATCGQYIGKLSKAIMLNLTVARFILWTNFFMQGDDSTIHGKWMPEKFERAYSKKQEKARAYAVFIRE